MAIIGEELGKYKEYYQECDFGRIREEVKHQSHYNDGFNIIVSRLTDEEVLYLKSLGYLDILDYYIINFWT